VGFGILGKKMNNVSGVGVMVLGSSLREGSRSEINYTGKKLDPSTGLYYFNQRYYDPELGRFITHDPAKQGLNPYAYCANNPLMYVDPNGKWFFAWIVAVAVEGLKAAAINASFQWSLKGFDSRNINWNSVGTSFISGGITGGLEGVVTPGGSDLLSYMTAHGVNNGITNVAIQWATGKGGDFWGDFGYGFQTGALGGAGKWAFKEFVGYNPRMKSGHGVMGKDGESHRKLGEDAREWFNVIGNPRSNKPEGFAEVFINDFFPGREGDFLSNTLNFFPGANSSAHLHDKMVGFFNLGTVLSGITIPIAHLINVYMLYPEFENYY